MFRIVGVELSIRPRRWFSAASEYGARKPASTPALISLLAVSLSFIDHPRELPITLRNISIAWVVVNEEDHALGLGAESLEIWPLPRRVGRANEPDIAALDVASAGR